MEIPIIVYGILGGAAPEIFRIHKKLLDGKKFSYSRNLFIVSCIIAFFGGLMVLALNVTTPIQAIYVGVSTPAIISSMINNPKEVN